MGTKNSGYSFVNLLMDMVMVVSIVVFLNVSLRLVPENEKFSSLFPSSLKIIDNTHTSSSANQKVKLTSSAVPSIHIQIGEEAEQEKVLPPSSVPLFIRKSVYNFAMKKSLISKDTTIDTINIPETIRSTATIKTYINGEESTYVPPNGFVHNDAFPYDITLTTIVPISRIGNILKLTSWSGPVNVCVYASKSDEDRAKIMDFIRNKELNRKVTLVVLYSDFSDVVYPVNTLKNIAISTVFTTHFIMIDDTMIPSELLYDKLRKIPVSVLYEPIHLVTIPVFFSEEEAKSRKNVNTCIVEKKCFPKYTALMPEWYDPHNAKYYMRALQCMESSKVYYFMRRYNSFIIPYDEQFVTRGYDDLSLLQYLIRDGYHFHVLLDGYFVDTSSALELENEVLQNSEEIRSQFKLYQETVMPSKDNSMAVCVDKKEVAVLKDYMKFLDVDAKKREEEVEKLKKDFESMNRKVFDVMAWNRKVVNTADIQNKRIKANL